MAAIETSVGAPRLTPAGRLRLGSEILRAYVTVRRLSANRRLPAVVAALRATPLAPGAPLADPRTDGRRLGAAVMRALTITPGGTRCLMRSLVLLVLLARRGVEAQLIIAVQPGPVTLDAHAWVELDGAPLLPPGDAHERLLVL